MVLDDLPGNTRDFEILAETYWVRLEESGIEQDVNEG